MRVVRSLFKVVVCALMLTLVASAASAEMSLGAELVWSRSFGTDYKNAPSPPALKGDFLYIFSGKRLVKTDRFTGETVGISDRETSYSSRYAIVAPTFGAGMVFVPLGKGSVAAFDENSLELLWETPSHGGQGNCPIVYANGKIFFGTWVSETREGSFCGYAVSRENCQCLWSFSVPGGFYRTSAFYENDTVTFGSDDGAEEGDRSTAALYTLDAETGEVLNKVGGIEGDIRSDILKYNNAWVFSTKAGYIYKVEGDGVKKIKTGDSCGASPVIVGDVAYVGTGDGFVAAVDIKNMRLKEKYPAPGYPNGGITSGGKTLLFTCNTLPGGLYTLENGEVRELFAPYGEEAQYCISPVALSEDGTAYYKNDSGNVFALKLYGKLKIECDLTEEMWLVYPKSDRKIVPIQIKKGINEIKIEGFPAYIWRKNLQPVTGVISL